MHELSVAQGIIDGILQEARNSNLKQVSDVEIDVGELMQLDIRALRGAVRLISESTILEKSKIKLHVSHASFLCRKCGKKWTMSEARKQLERVSDNLRVREPDSKELPLHFLPYLYPAFLQCPKCGSSDTNAVSGEDIRIKRLVGK